MSRQFRKSRRTDIPIIFSAPMVRALLDGQKTQTRRLIRGALPQAPAMDNIHPSHKARHPAPYLAAYCGERKTTSNSRGMGDHWCWWTRDDRCGSLFRVGYAPGDRLWVREAHAILPRKAYRGSVGTGTIDQREHPTDGYSAAVFREGFDRSGRPPWRASIHMPRWASRLTLTVTDVRVQRLCGISKEDAVAEGIFPRLTAAGTIYDWKDGQSGWRNPREAFERLWAHINGPDAWEANPWVVALTFSVERRNIDAMQEAT